MKKYLFLALCIICIFIFYFKHEGKNYGFKKTNLKIDKIFIINLDKDKIRYHNTKKILLKLKVLESQIERLPATYGLDVKFYDYKNNIYFTGRELKKKTFSFLDGRKYRVICNDEISFDYNAYDPSLHNYKYNSLHQTSRKILTAGEFGCTCSHLRVLNKARKRNYNRILIFEDDVLLSNNYYKDLDLIEYIKSYNNINQINILYLFSHPNLKGRRLKKLKNQIKYFFLRKKNEILFINQDNDMFLKLYVTMAMMVDKKAIHQILNNKEISLTTDELYGKEILYSKNPLTGGLMPYFIFDHIWGGDNSSITKLGRI